MSFDLLLNSLNLFLKERYGDQCREFVCGYWGITNLATATCRSEIICLVKDRLVFYVLFSFPNFSFVLILSVGPGV